MSTWLIEHPDTIGYHIQIIKWIEEMKIVPGIANLNVRFGFQNIWFCVTGFFSFNFTGWGHYVYLNSFFVLLVTSFLIDKISLNYQRNHIIPSVLWLVLLAFSLLSYTQIRLTSSSTSPDYICAIYILATFYLIYQMTSVNEKPLLGIVFLFSTFSLAVKLSAVPLAIVSIYSFFVLVKSKRYKLLTKSLILPVLLIIILLTRNALTSGYMLYPSNALNIISPVWKLDENKTRSVSDYITMYARIRDVHSPEKVEAAKKLHFFEWTPVWWDTNSYYDKILLLLLLGSLIRAVVQMARFRLQNNYYTLIRLSCLAGITFWFFKAPDVRFGYGFILALIAIEVITLNFSIRFQYWRIATIKYAIFFLAFFCTSYAAYRCAHYLSPKQILLPVGLVQAPIIKETCNGIDFSISPINSCSNAALPCTEFRCDDFVPIGTELSEGFKP